MRRNALGLVQGLDIAAKIRKQDTGVRKPAMDMANMQIVAEVRPSPLMCGARALSCMEPEPSHVWGPSPLMCGAQALYCVGPEPSHVWGPSPLMCGARATPSRCAHISCPP